MDNARGTFIVIEGTDGSGKGTQFKLLRERLERGGYDIATFDFPQYEQPSSFFVREYLNGKYGTADEVGPYTASLFYALDRYQVAGQIRTALAEGKIVLTNRFTGSSMAHQGTKFRHIEERRGYFIWLDNLEFEMLHIPRPDMSVVLRVPAEIAQKLVDQKEARSYTDQKRDIHEADLGHLQRAAEVYDDMCQLFPKDFTPIDCVRGGELLDVETVQELLWQKVAPLLPEAPATRPGYKPVTLLPELADKNGTEAAKAGQDAAVPAAAASAPQAAKVAAAKTTTAPASPYLYKTDEGTYEITEAGKQFLREAVTNIDGNVYALTEKLGPLTAAASMARLSRRGDDMRVTILDEFATTIGKDEKLLQRVITAYGDDSVQQLVGIHLVVEQASNLLTKKLEWGRLAAYLEQSTRYIYFDQKTASGSYKYHTPEHLPGTVKQQYRTHMDRIFDLYSEIIHKLAEYIGDNSSVPHAERDAAWKSAVRAQACDAARPVLPVATTSTVGIFASGQALESLIMHLLADPLPEAQTIGKQLLAEARKTMPVFLERADKPDRGGAIIAYQAATAKAMQALANELLPDQHAATAEPVQLVDFWPRNELDLAPDMLYAHSTLSLRDLRRASAKWPYARKAKVLETYIGERLNRRQRPGRALEKAHYSWDIMCDYGIFRDLQRHRMVDDLEWQQLTPRYGYEVPQLVEDAGLGEQFEACFDASLELYSLLQEAGHPLEAQYATLLGHRMRWKVTYNAREAFHLHELRTSPQGHPGYRKLVGIMHQKLSEVHPILGEGMRFVNQGEDPELTRLAAERYTQFKLANLGADDSDDSKAAGD